MHCFVCVGIAHYRRAFATATPSVVDEPLSTTTDESGDVDAHDTIIHGNNVIGDITAADVAKLVEAASKE
jgi:hypothetical protein